MPDTRLRTECYRCGLAVCKACSKLKTDRGRRIRICRTCDEDDERFKRKPVTVTEALERTRNRIFRSRR